MSKIWFVTGSAGGLGAGIAKAALAAGHKVVATDLESDRLQNHE
jgi:NAD(P)-dependent dehydrogenase (short-subunit alcohol dehydrogenase family)